ncbi:hypothetical protein N7478_010002 [Penicillium angulare]|uniref:uncharacterized protein n=1 Tax=Penicillium angulare TaxID=116970 RepID=UPI002540D5D4|nr:uncharacterized protein N7478_010002 [Penicillium angulare]KAJ5267194.1 hypothetical protein N7478_010002 [Penicillium angulare]
MALTFLVNTLLLAIPLGGSVGTLVGIDAHRAATGQKGLFAGDSDSNGGTGSSGGSGGSDSTGGGSGSNNTISDNHTKNSQYCQSSYGITPPTQGEQFTLNPNQWGVTDTTSGWLCMNVTTFNNETYATKTTTPDWSVTWQFDPGPQTQPVHAFPNIQVEDVLPIVLNGVDSIDFDLAYTYGVGKTVATTMDESALTAQSLQANVAVDMFFDSDKETSQNSTAASLEVMVWFARFGASSDPIGYPRRRHQPHGRCELYKGPRTSGSSLYTLTWVATENTASFNGDLYPLIKDLYSMSGSHYPNDTDYMGIFQFGSEAYSSDSNVTFAVSELSIDISKS